MIVLIIVGIIVNIYAFIDINTFINVLEPEYRGPSVNYTGNSQQIKDILSEQIQVLERLEKQLNEEYTISNPLIIMDPFKSNELSAIAVFKTERPAKIVVSVNKGDAYSINYIDYAHGFTTVHIIPIFGLRENFDNIVTLRSNNRFWLADETKLTIETKNEQYTAYQTQMAKMGSIDERFFMPVKYQKSLMEVVDFEGNVRLNMNNNFCQGYSSVINRNNFICEGKDDDIYIRYDSLGLILDVYSLPINGKYEFVGKDSIFYKDNDGDFKLLNLKSKKIQSFDLDQIQNEIIDFSVFSNFNRAYFLLSDQSIYIINLSDGSQYDSFELPNTDFLYTNIAVNNSNWDWNNREGTEILIYNEDRINVFSFEKKSRKIIEHFDYKDHVDFAKFEDNGHIQVISDVSFKMISMNGDIRYHIDFNEQINQIQFYEFIP